MTPDETFAVADFGGPCPHVEALTQLHAEWLNALAVQRNAHDLRDVLSGHLADALERAERAEAALAEAQRERDDARATHQELATEFERLRDEAERMRPVVEAAREIVADWRKQPIEYTEDDEELLSGWSGFAIDLRDAVGAFDASRSSVPLEDLIEAESARSPEFAAAAEATSNALDVEAQT